MFVDDFRDWTGEIKLSDGSVIVATSLRGDKLIAGSVEFDRETGSAVTGQQIDSAELYRVQGKTYRRREAGRAAYEIFAKYVNWVPAFDDLQLNARQSWGEVLFLDWYALPSGLYYAQQDLAYAIARNMPAFVTRWAALTENERHGWAAVWVWALQNVKAARYTQDLPPISQTICILNALLELDRSGVSEALQEKKYEFIGASDAPLLSPPLAWNKNTYYLPAGKVDLIEMINCLYPLGQDGQDTVRPIIEGGIIQRFEAGSAAQGGFVPDEHGRPKLVMCGGRDGPAAAHHIQVNVNLPPPESMHGFCDQQGGTDDPRPPFEPNPR